MKKIAALFLSLLAASLPLVAQDNPYDIEDVCYRLFMQAEILCGTPEFQAVNDSLLAEAKAYGDTKAETLYYVEELKHKVRMPSSPDNDRAVDAAWAELKQVSRDYGFPQYYYYAYQLAQNYFYENGQLHRTRELLEEMQQTALKENDVYGLWTGDKYLASLYIDQNDYVSAKKFIMEALRVYDTTEDQTIRRQSPCRLYCDLADTYPFGSDSIQINVNKAFATSKQHMDTLRSRYYLAKLAALDGDIPAYEVSRDYYLRDPQARSISKSGPEFFGLLDAVIEGRIDGREEEILALERIRETKLVANLCEQRGYKDLAFDLEKKLVQRLETALSMTNQSRLSELDVSMGKAALSADLATKERQMAKISLLMAILLAVMLAGVVLFSWVHIRHLRRGKVLDGQRIEELKAANEKVQLANAAKTRFVQNMSHEVRTPLNAIVGFSQLLALPDGSFPPEEKDEFAGHIVNNTKMLTMLLDDILNASAMDSGNYRITYEPGEVHFICQAAISSAEHRLQPGVKMYYAPESDQPFEFTTDPRRVQQILINLLTNACKHTTSGEIRLSSSLTEHPGEVTFSVTDTGPGVPADQAEKIFDRFTKLNDFVQGTGLGLSICRDIAGRMGARVFLDTNYTAGGARFVFVVPVLPLGAHPSHVK